MTAWKGLTVYLFITINVWFTIAGLLLDPEDIIHPADSTSTFFIQKQHCNHNN